MSWNYRKRIKIAPGVTINLGKRGASATVGVPGFHITAGNKGVYANIGLPGTGLYSRTKIIDYKTLSIDNEQVSGGIEANANNSPNSKKGERIALWIIISIIMGLISFVILFQTTSDGIFEIGISLLGLSVCFFLYAIITVILNSSSDSEKEEKDVFDCRIEEAQKELEATDNSLKKQILTSYIEYLRTIASLDESYQIIEQLNLLSQKKRKREIEDLLKKEIEKVNLLNEDIEKKAFTCANNNDVVFSTFNEVCSSLSNLVSEKKIWHLYDGERKQLNFSLGTFALIKSDFNVPIISMPGGIEYFIYPEYIIESKSLIDFNIIDKRNVSISSSEYSTYEETTPPEGCEIIFKRWKHMNMDGGIDHRYSYNPRVYFVKYGIVKMKNPDISLILLNQRESANLSKTVSRWRDSPQMKEINQILDKINSGSDKHTSLADSTFFILKASKGTRLADFYLRLTKDESFMELFTEKAKGICGAAVCEAMDSKQLLLMFVLHDLLYCYKQFGYEPNFKKKEGYPLFFFIYKALNPEGKLNGDNYSRYENLLSPKIQVLLSTCRTAQFLSKSEFMLCEVLNEDDYYLSSYLTNLYNFADVVANADGVATKKELAWISRILDMKTLSDAKYLPVKLAAEKDLQEQFEKLRTESQEEKKTLTSIQELDSLIGLNTVKQDINTLINYITIQKAREQKGLKNTPISYHCIFTGNPGTGKTTVARIVANIYKELGIIQKGHLVETDRSGLVAEYVGQTAIKTNRIIDSALDGVLFIDEAYSLVNGGNADYGKEAISTLLKRMEDDRDRLVVILAGYTSDMDRFIDSNPGLKSRFNKCIHFDDYNEEELFNIYTQLIKKFDYTMSDLAAEKLKRIINRAIANKDENFGNGRFVRNMFEETLKRQANRLALEDSLSSEKLTRIEEDDID